MKSKKGKVLSAVLGIALALAQIPASVSMAAWMPDHQIPAYQQKDIFETDTVTISGLTVKEIVNATVSPTITRSLDKEVKFVIFNSTKQIIEQEVISKDGRLPDLNLVDNHNYIIWAEDSEYRMSNVYVWVKNGHLVDIKKNVDTGNYPEVESLELYKREQRVDNPEEEQRVRSNIKVYSPYGGLLYNVKFKLVSNVETLEYSTGNSGKLMVDLLEDVIYMVTVENPNYAIDSFPLVIKDKSEYGAGKYTYDFSSCAKVDEIHLMDKKDAHKNDTVLTNTNYSEIYQGIYENVAGNTTITGMNFKDFLVLDRKLDKSTVQGMDGKDYEVFDIKVVNPHRWEIAYIAAGDYQITEKLDNTKTVKNVYYVDKEQKLQSAPFTQDGSNVTFSMNTLSMYPIVVEYDLQEVDTDNTTLKIKVVDEKGNPVSGLKLYLKSQEYGTLGDITVDAATDASGKTSYQYSGDEFGDDIYELLPTTDSGYEVVTSREITFDEDEKCIATVDDEEYKGEEITLVVKKIGGSEPEEPENPEADNTTLKIKVVDGKGNPVSGLKLYLKSQEYGTFGDITVDAATDASGKTSYQYSGDEFGDDIYELLPTTDSGYEVVTSREITFDEDEKCIATVDDEEYKGEEITLVVKKIGGSEPEKPEKPGESEKPGEPEKPGESEKPGKPEKPGEPEKPEVETMVNEVNASISEIGPEGGNVTITVSGSALPDKMYYAIYYVKQGTYTEEERVASEALEIETQGSTTEKTMTIALPKAEQYPGVLRWRIGVTDANPEEGYYFATPEISITKVETPEKPEKPDSGNKADKEENKDNKQNNNTVNKNDKTNAKKNNPQTGDTAMAIPFGTGLLVSFAILCILAFKKRLTIKNS